MAAGESDNPHWDILNAVASALAGADPAIEGLPTPQVRELPYVLKDLDARPLCFITTPDGAGEKVVKHLFGSGAAGTGVTWWGYPVVVLLIFDSNRAVSSGLQSRLALRHAVGERLFATSLAGSAQVFDCDPDPRAARDVQAALGKGMIVSGFQFTYRYPRTRKG